MKHQSEKPMIITIPKNIDNQEKDKKTLPEVHQKYTQELLDLVDEYRAAMTPFERIYKQALDGHDIIMLHMGTEDQKYGFSPKQVELFANSKIYALNNPELVVEELELIKMTVAFLFAEENNKIDEASRTEDGQIIYCECNKEKITTNDLLALNNIAKRISKAFII